MVKMAGEGLEPPGQVVLVLQGGGALGAYQVGVFQAMHEAGIEPDWVIGTSIGAINGAIIAGNPPAGRMRRLDAFWDHVRNGTGIELPRLWPGLDHLFANFATVTQGIPAFFSPRPQAWGGMSAPLGVEAASYYSTEPLRQTLEELVDFSLINEGHPRLTVGAAHVRTSMMHYFDSKDMEVAPAHIMASGALPPAFPAVRIDGELYWDGGILSNTPTERIFDDHPRRNSLIFAVHLWNPTGDEPTTIWEILNRHKDIQYSSSSRATSCVSARRTSSATSSPSSWNTCPRRRGGIRCARSSRNITATRACMWCGCSRRQ